VKAAESNSELTVRLQVGKHLHPRFGGPGAGAGK
jgi:hypothetical protein